MALPSRTVREIEPEPSAAGTDIAGLLLKLPDPYQVDRCRQLLQHLIQVIDWQHDYLAFGRRFAVPRVQAWYADTGVHYRYSNNMLRHRSWIPGLLSIKADVERLAGQRFNSVLVTHYRDGRDHVTWHADDEPELGDAPVIASLSLGASRIFQYRPKHGNDENQSMPLHDGQLLLMKPDFQRNWLHAVPAQPEVKTPRLNLTFRQVHQTRGRADGK